MLKTYVVAMLSLQSIIATVEQKFSEKMPEDFVLMIFLEIFSK